MLNFFSTLFVTLTTTFAFATAPNCGVPLTLEQAVQQSNTIVEGYITQAECFENNGSIFTRYQLHITKQFGTDPVVIINSQLSIIEEGGTYNGIQVQTSHSHFCHVGLHGVFFLKQHDANYAYASDPIAYHNVFLNPVAGGFGKNYNSITEVYQHLEGLGLNAQVLDPTYEARLYVKEAERQARAHTRWLKHQKEEEHWEAVNTSTDKAFGDSLRMRLGGYRITGHTTKVCEVPILVQHNGATYLYSTSARIQFSTTAFDASNLQVSQYFPSTSNAYTPQFSLVGGNSLDFSFTPLNTTGTQRLHFTGGWDTLCVIRLTYNNCMQGAGLQLLSTTQGSAYTPTPTGVTNTFTNFTVTDRNTTARNFPICEPLITSIVNPATNDNVVRGGTWDELIIKGEHFGSRRDSTYLRNADNGNHAFLRLDSIDHLVWTDTLVKIRVPSRMYFTDKSYVVGANSYSTNGIDGLIGIGNQWGGIDTTIGQYLYIKWSGAEGFIRSIYDNNGDIRNIKTKRYLNSKIPKSRYTFYLNTSITDPDMKRCIRAAINEWRCKTGVNFYLSDSVVSNSINNNDSINVIGIKALGANVLLETFKSDTTGNACRNIEFTSWWSSLLGVDIAVNSVFLDQFYYDTVSTRTVPSNKQDFYSVLLHELGHALLLNHVINKEDLMYWAFDYGAPKNIDPMSLEGANYVVDASINNPRLATDIQCPNSSNILYLQAMERQECPTLGIEDLALQSSLVLYPNPTNGTVYLKGLEEGVSYNIRVYSLIGQELYQQVLNSSSNAIHLQELNKGFYILTLLHNNQQHTFKLCKE